MAKRGTRTKLDEGKRHDLITLLGLGCSRRTAARYVGCTVAAIENTLRDDPEFSERVLRAEQQAEIGYLQNIKQAAKKEQYWRAAAWALERRNPEDFAARGPDVITLDQMKQLLARFAQLIMEEVPDPRYRQNILKRLDGLSADLAPSSRRKGKP